MEFEHTPVLLKEVLEGLDIKPDGVYVDGTVGGAGHSGEIAGRLGDKGKLYCFDQDEDALKVASERLERYGDNAEALRDAGIAYAVDQITDLIAEGVDGIHLYTMNNPYTANKIFDAVKSFI